MGDTVLERLDLRVDAHLCGWQSGNTHLHFDKLYPTLLFSLGGNLFDLSDGRFSKVLDTQTVNQLVYDFSLDWCWFHIVCDLLFVLLFRAQKYEKASIYPSIFYNINNHEESGMKINCYLCTEICIWT